MTALVLWHTTRRVVPAGGFYAGMPVNGDRPGAVTADGQLWQREAERDEVATKAELLALIHLKNKLAVIAARRGMSVFSADDNDGGWPNFAKHGPLERDA